MNMAKLTSQDWTVIEKITYNNYCRWLFCFLYPEVEFHARSKIFYICNHGNLDPKSEQQPETQKNCIIFTLYIYIYTMSSNEFTIQTDKV